MKTLHEFRHWILLAVAVIVTAHVVAYEQHNAATKYQNRRARYCASLGGSTQQQKACMEEKHDAKNELPWWAILYTWPDGFTVWAIIGTAFIIAWQSYETRRAAESTLHGIEIGKTKERARLEVSIALLRPMEGQHPQVPMQITNVGESTARITRAVAALEITPPEGKIEGSARDLRVHETALKAGENSDETVFHIKPLGRYPAGIEDGEWDVHLVGDIRFTDAFDDHWRLPIHYIWRAFGHPIYGFPDGPREGEWENQKPKGEYKTEAHAPIGLWQSMQKNPPPSRVVTPLPPAKPDDPVDGCPD